MDSLLTIGVSNAAAVAVLSVLLIPLARWLRRPALTHAVCVLLLFKLVTPPVFTLPLHWLPSAGGAGDETRIVTVAAHQEPVPARPEPAAVSDEVDQPDLSDEVPIDDWEALAPLPPAPVEPAPAPVPIRPTPRPAPFPWARAIAIAWLTAAGLCTAM